jgi:hypothetical protein
MGTVIRFPVERCRPRDSAEAQLENRSAAILILPVIRREPLREVVAVPQTGTSPGRGRPVRRSPT